MRTIMVHTGVVRASNKTVRQSVSLPANVATTVRSLAKARRLSANRILVELIETGIEAQNRKEKEFFDLAERFRNAKDPKKADRLGDQLGRMVFGNARIGARIVEGLDQAVAWSEGQASNARVTIVPSADGRRARRKNGVK